MTLRVALALWVAAQAAAVLAPLPPTTLAAVALAGAFSLPLAHRALRHELQLVGASAAHVWETRLAPALLPPPAARFPVAVVAAWLAWRCSGGATRAFLAFLAVVRATDVVGDWAMRFAASEGHQEGIPRGSSCTLRELEAEEEADT